MDGYDADDLSSMIEKVTSGATGALGRIKMTGYDSSKLSGMVEKITSGSTGALGKSKCKATTRMISVEWLKR